ncbi:MAG: DUF389 domain-containing protein [Dehalococcoidia bacterium]|nr:DUF389 domain-containing protein [Dehalococcoidia bacterium]
MPAHSTLPPGRLRADIFREGRPDLRFRLLVWFSAVIATLGLIADSTAVVIGAMLVAPLLGPLMAIGEASLGSRRRQGLIAVRALAEGAVTAIVISFVLAEVTMLSSFDVLEVLPDEVQARTRPNPLDLGIALAGGAIGAYAVARMRDSAALPGVAIATALMPPLCTVGIGLAVEDRGVWGGALLLFATNLAAIVFTAGMVFWALGLGPRRRNGYPVRQAAIGFLPILFLGFMLFGLTARAVGEARESESLWDASNAALAEVLPGSELTDLRRSNGPDGAVNIHLTIRTAIEPTLADAEAIQALIAQRRQKKIALVLVSVPAIVLDPLHPPARDVTVAIPTRTITPDSDPTPTETSTPTPSPTATPTPTPAPTPSPTSIPPAVGNSPGG